MDCNILDDALIIETALEVANPIGGICTVIKTKAPSLLKHVKKSNFLMLGLHTDKSEDYVEKSLDEVPFIKETVTRFEQSFGIKCVFAEWSIDPDPNLCPNILLFDNLDFYKVRGELDKAMYFLGISYGIHFPDPSFGMDYFKYNGLLLGTFVNLFIRYLLGQRDEKTSTYEGMSPSHLRPIILQSHEWCGSIGQLLLQRDKSNIPGGKLLRTVFTTHATILGRYLSADNQNIVELIANNSFPNDGSLFNEARRRLIDLEFGAEWAAAHSADIFTAVSDTTANEAAAFLKRRPQVITYNGSKLPTSILGEDLSLSSKKDTISRNSSKETKRNEDDSELTTSTDSPKKNKTLKDDEPECIKTTKTTTVDGCSNNPDSNPINKVNLITGIHEVTEFIEPEIEKHLSKEKHKSECRSKLNDFIRRHFFGPSLETMDFKKTIYFMCCGRNEFSNKGIDMFIDSLAKLNTRLKSLQERYSRRMDVTIVGILITPSLLAHPPIVPGGHFEYVMRKEQEALSNPDAEHDLMKVDMKLSRTEHPPLCAGCVDGGKEIIIQKCLAANLVNHPLDPVKFLWIPKFMPFGDVLKMSIDEVYEAIDCGVFPSRYEPWGYTPLECLEHGVPAITTNLAGCGCFYEKAKDSKLSKSCSNSLSLMVHSDSWRRCPDGLVIIDRLHSNYEEAATRIADSLYDYISLDFDEVESLTRRCIKGSKLCSWDKLVMNYLKCYCKLMESVEKSEGGEK